MQHGESICLETPDDMSHALRPGVNPELLPTLNDLYTPDNEPVCVPGHDIAEPYVLADLCRLMGVFEEEMAAILADRLKDMADERKPAHAYNTRRAGKKAALPARKLAPCSGKPSKHHREGYNCWQNNYYVLRKNQTLELEICYREQ